MGSFGPWSARRRAASLLVSPAGCGWRSGVRGRASRRSTTEIRLTCDRMFAFGTYRCKATAEHPERLMLRHDCRAMDVIAAPNPDTTRMAHTRAIVTTWLFELALVAGVVA